MTQLRERARAPQRILLVDGAAEERRGLCELLERYWRVSAVGSADEGLALLQDEAGVAVALCDIRVESQGGSQFLRRVRALSPSTVGLLLAPADRLEEGLRALGRGAAERLVQKPARLDELRAAVEAAILMHEQREAELLERAELEFVSESLRGMTERLEEHVLLRSDALRRIHGLAVELDQARGLAELARVAARTAYDGLGGPGVHVQVWDPEQVCVEANFGPEMSSRMHREPLSTRDGVVGELVVDAARVGGEGLDELARELVAGIASTTAIAVHNELRRRERDEAQYATVVALARLSERRDDQTGKHLERVSSYCRLVAEGLRAAGHYPAIVDDAFVRDLERSAPLHDIGKVGIPDSILLKPGKLSPEEWEIMKTHAELGAQTLSSVLAVGRRQSFLEMGRDIAHAHHEKWDGSGYPRGLAGEAIPLAARIVALADVYDALTTVRPYKQAWTHERALAWIRQGAGTHFDPRVVQAFVARAAEADAIRQRLADDPRQLEAHEPDLDSRPVH